MSSPQNHPVNLSYPASSAPRAQRGPGWCGTTALVVAGMLLSSALTLGGMIGYDALTDSGGASAPETGSAASTPIVASNDAPDWATIAERVSPSTVAIANTSRQGESQGTGVIIDPNGLIVTNNHVVAGATQITATLADGRTFVADMIGADPSTDLAVIRLTDPPTDLVAASFGDSSAMVVGEPVMAVGTPLGLQNTVTTGIVSALNRPVTTAGEDMDPASATYTSAVQTDAAVNPGNSGGPLVNTAGEVIGINSSIASFADSQQRAGSIGLGFAIPSDTVELIASQLIDSGSVRHALLGVTASPGTVTLDKVTYRGAQVEEVVPGSAADAAGLRRGDLIVSVDDIPVDDAAALTGLVRGLPVGSEHTVAIYRGAAPQDVTVTLGASEG